ncbi:cytochrome c-type biogenesis protein CcmH [Duganella sp. CT11-25]|uniref:cytochrome c-type biogenesis protein n=1 Tax=unclassified Duganella TaxID=2636909 RepID=UPI0039AFAA29
MRRWCALLLLAGAALVAHADDGAALEKRVDHVAQQLRCLVCQNQSIADSHAQLALDLKKEARTQLSQGRSEQEVIDFMVQRYGDFVLYRPPFNAATLLLWIGPFALLVAGLAALLVNLRRRGLGADDPVLEENE